MLESYMLACRAEPHWEEMYAELGFQRSDLKAWLKGSTMDCREAGRIEDWIAEREGQAA